MPAKDGAKCHAQSAAMLHACAASLTREQSANEDDVAMAAKQYAHHLKQQKQDAKSKSST